MGRARCWGATLLLLAAVAVGCKGKGEATGASGAALVDRLPADSRVVVGLDVGKLMASRIGDKLGGRLRDAAAPLMVPLVQHCKLDGLATVERLVLGGAGELDPTDFAFAVRTRPARAEVDRCVLTMLDKANETPAKLLAEGALSGYAIQGEGGETAWVAWADDHTLLLRPGALIDKRVAQALARPAGKPSDDATMKGLLAAVDTSHAMWLVAAVGPGSQIAGAFAFLPEAPVGVAVDADAGQGLTLKATLRFASADAAGKARTNVDKALAENKPRSLGALDDVKVTTSGTDVVVTITLDAARLDALLALADSLLGPPGPPGPPTAPVEPPTATTTAPPAAPAPPATPAPPAPPAP